MQKFLHKSIRLPGFDYTQPGVYFITICTDLRRLIFGTIIKDEMHLNPAGIIARNCWLTIPEHFSGIQTCTIIVMPNHIHGIITILETTVEARQCRASTTEQFGKPVKGSIPTIIRSYKSIVSREIRRLPGLQGQTIWQRNYYEHVVRTDQELARIHEYILFNPIQWELDSENPENTHCA